ncbi:MAG TPA: methyltransferase domain-containing protein [Hyphomonadaceae bacterium]|nr:methyltransferase domain-containing protein [Hyphomonadaceae bacterium]HPN04297.1 methyltransferase domain-containing protein [Hyphomonadaceae bacterium]
MREIDTRQGQFGEIRIMERRRDGARLYCVGDGVQTMSTPDGTSLFGYVHAIKLLIGSVSTVLMLGGGGGSLATMLARRGVNVTVVDIDPVAEDIARSYFGLDYRVKWITEDAGAFLTSCPDKFDAVVIDTCDARGAVEALATVDSLVESLGLVREDGSLVLNLANNGGSAIPAWQVASAMVDLGFPATLYRPALGNEGNELLHVPVGKPRTPIKIGDLSDRPMETRLYLSTLEAFIPGESGPYDFTDVSD